MTLTTLSRLTFCALLALVGTYSWGQAARNDASLSALYSEGQLRSAAKYAQELLEVCPPTECLIVSLGSTNILLDSNLRVAIEEGKAPKTYLNYAPLAYLSSLDNSSWDDVREAWFDRILPSPVDAGNKTIVFTRTIYGGETIMQIAPRIHEYYRDRGFKGRLGVFLVGSSESIEIVGATVTSFFEELGGIAETRVDAEYGKLAKRAKNGIYGTYEAPDEAFARYRTFHLPMTSIAPPADLMIEQPRHSTLDRLIKRYRCETIIE